MNKNLSKLQHKKWWELSAEEYQIVKTATIWLMTWAKRWGSINIPLAVGWIIDSLWFVPSTWKISLNPEIFHKNIWWFNFSVFANWWYSVWKTIDLESFSATVSNSNWIWSWSINEKASTNTKWLNEAIVQTAKAIDSFILMQTIDKQQAESIAGRKLTSQEFNNLQANFKEFKAKQKALIDNAWMSPIAFRDSYIKSFRDKAFSQVEWLQITWLGFFIIPWVVAWFWPSFEYNSRNYKPEKQAVELKAINDSISKVSVQELINSDKYLRDKIKISWNSVVINWLNVGILGNWVNQNSNTYSAGNGQNLRLDIVRKFDYENGTSKNFTIYLSTTPAETWNRWWIELWKVVKNKAELDSILAGFSPNARSRYEKWAIEALKWEWDWIVKLSENNRAISKLLREYPNPTDDEKAYIIWQVQALLSTSNEANYRNTNLHLEKIIAIDRNRSHKFDEIISKLLWWNIHTEREVLLNTISIYGTNRNVSFAKWVAYDVKHTLVWWKAVNKGLQYMPSWANLVADWNWVPILQTISDLQIKQALAQRLAKDAWINLKDINLNQIQVFLWKDPNWFDDVLLVRWKIWETVLNNWVTWNWVSGWDILNPTYSSFWGSVTYTPPTPTEPTPPTPTEPTPPTPPPPVEDGETWHTPENGETWHTPENGETWHTPEDGETWHTWKTETHIWWHDAQNISDNWTKHWIKHWTGKQTTSPNWTQPGTWKWLNPRDALKF